MQELDCLFTQNAFIEYVPVPGTASGKEEDTDGLVKYGPSTRWNISWQVC